jgi:hypothetical protein
MSLQINLSRPAGFPVDLKSWEPDTAIVCKDGLLQASSLLLVLHSKLFESIFSELDPADSKIILPDIRTSDIEQLLGVLCGKYQELYVNSSLVVLLNILLTVHEVGVSIFSESLEGFYINLSESDLNYNLENDLEEIGLDTGDTDNSITDYAYSTEDVIPVNDTFICGICNKKFSKKKYLCAHVQWKHCDEETKQAQQMSSKEKSLNRSCDICGKLFNSRTISAHIKSHINDNKFQCQLCDKIFTSDSNVRRHIENDHEGITAFTCEKCDFKTKRKDNMYRHTSTKHTPKSSIPKKTRIFQSKFSLFQTILTTFHFSPQKNFFLGGG